MYFSNIAGIVRISLKLKRGRRLEIFVNTESELIVCDIIAKHGKGGNEFIRKNFSMIKTPTEKECKSDDEPESSI